MVAVGRMVTEVGVAQYKVPLNLALASVWFFGKVDVQEIVSYSKVPQDLTTVFAYDNALLKARLKNVKVVHFIPDLTQINGEQRLGLIATFSEEVDNAYTPASVVLYSSSVASKQATEQFRTVKEVARSFDISTKLGHLLADEGKDITGYVGGLHTLIWLMIWVCRNVYRQSMVYCCVSWEVDNGKNHLFNSIRDGCTLLFPLTESRHS